MTDRLYYTDAYLRIFTARVTAAEPRRVILDRTAFYPTSGGQPNDIGTLAGAPVTDVIDDGQDIIHVLAERDALETPAPGSEVQGALDWGRRFDHMQQHTAQHVLSAVFARVLGAETVSVHLGGSSTIDLAVPALSAEDARRVEDEASQIVFDNRPVTVRFVDEDQVVALGLRRPPKRTGMIRVVEVADCDRSACGGTHVRATGEIGPVLLRRWERSRGHLRVEFLSGWRALADYRSKHALVSEWSARLTVSERDLGGALDRLAASARDQERALSEARERLIIHEAVERLAAAVSKGGRKILRLAVSGREAGEIRQLLREMTGREPSVVLAGDEASGRLYFARSQGEGPGMAALMADACRSEGGRGGGTAEFAQGAVPPGESVTRALAIAEEAAGRA
jgi:alanyl-tRNA synthetase